MTQDELKMVLEALEMYGKRHRATYLLGGAWDEEITLGGKAITAIEEQLAEHAMSEVQRLGQEIEQEPVCDKDPKGCWNVRCQLGKKCKNTPPQRTWVGLTDEDMYVVSEEESCSFIAGAKWSEAILKEKNT